MPTKRSNLWFGRGGPSNVASSFLRTAESEGLPLLRKLDRFCSKRGAPVK